MAKKDSFVLYTDQKAVIEKLSNEQAGQLIKAIYEYVDTGNLPNLDATLDLVITPFITILDRNRQKYEAKCEKNKENIQKRWNEKITKECIRIQTNTNHTDNDTVSDNDIVNDNDSDNSNNDIVSDSCVDGLLNANDSRIGDLQEVITFYEKNIGLITPYQLEVLSDYSKDMQNDLIILAMKKAVEANKRTIQYIKGILNNWHKKGIKTLIEAEKEDEQFRNKNSMQQEETEEEKIARKIKMLEGANSE